jgi:excisionase family DNA binding protein
MSLTRADVLSAAEVAELLGLPLSTVHALARAERLPSVKLGRRRLFLRQRVEAVLLGQESRL